MIKAKDPVDPQDGEMEKKVGEGFNYVDEFIMSLLLVIKVLSNFVLDL